MYLKSEIIRPRVYAAIPPDAPYTIMGVAWAGETDVVRISVTTNGGESWAEGTFVDPARRYAWRRWTFDWRTPQKPGRYTLLSRAMGADGSVQPEQHDPNYGIYVINYALPIDVFVGGPAGVPAMANLN
jgi:hypothetical protein